MIRSLGCIVFTALLAACAGSPAPRYYTLGAPQAAPARVEANAATVWVAPVTLPESVDRPQWVVRLGPNRVAILDQHRWAEPLAGAISRGIAANLSALLGGARVSTDAQHAAAGPQVRVLVDLQRFETVPGRGVTIEALWSVRGSSDAEPRRGHSLVSEAVAETADYEALAAAHTRALALLSREIAGAIQPR